MTSHGVLGLGLWLTLVGLTVPARGADAPAEPAAEDARRADAKARYEEGVSAYTSGHFKDAVDLFLAADRLSPSAPLSFNIARSYEKLGDDSGALRWYRDYLRRAPDAKNASDVAELVKRYEARLQAKGVQQVTLLSTPTGATIAIDGSAVGVTPGTFDLTPGRHKVVVMLRGYADAERDLDVAGDHAEDVTIELNEQAGAPPPTLVVAAPATGPAPPKQETPPSAGSGLGVWPYVTLGAGAAALAGALTFELLRQSSEQSAKDAKTQVEFKDHYDTMESQRTTARVLVGVGGALVVTGGVLLAIDLGSKKPKSSARLGIAPSEHGCTGFVTGSF